VLVDRAVRAADLHPVEEQLVVAQALAGLQDRVRQAFLRAWVPRAR
jgi:hypothetical protein